MGVRAWCASCVRIGAAPRSPARARMHACAAHSAPPSALPPLVPADLRLVRARVGSVAPCQDWYVRTREEPGASAGQRGMPTSTSAVLRCAVLCCAADQPPTHPPLPVCPQPLCPAQCVPLSAGAYKTDGPAKATRKVIATAWNTGYLKQAGCGWHLAWSEGGSRGWGLGPDGACTLTRTLPC